ncbi:MAG: serine/threonine-protein phosphatase [Planctomycetota bacterium]|nr:serine/threonine-protein phosphatase [Planctomycetota bacterium]
MVRPERFIEVGWSQRAKHGQRVPGDTIVVRRLPEEGRLVGVLADGLGSGVKAAVLSTLTATIAARHAAVGRDIRRAAELIARALPVCSVRRIGYSTFTIVDVGDDGTVCAFNSGNPAIIQVRGAASAAVGDEGPGLHASAVALAEGDRLLVCSDGVTQAGMGRADLPFGWGLDGLQRWLQEQLAARADASAQALAEAVVAAATAYDGEHARDDTSCLVVHLRRPRHLTVITGPPYDSARDAEIAALCRDAPGRVAICGGTTADIIAPELDRPLIPDDAPPDPEIPPCWRMPGVALVTEGMITLAAVLRLLEAGPPWPRAQHGAARLLELLLDSDVIDLVVGTRVNPAHQDPSLPVELGIRRNLLRAIAAVLAERYARAVSLRFV